MAEQASNELPKAENDRLRRTLLIVVSERKKMASQITGVQNLGVQSQKKEQELRTFSERNERLESSLARAENRIRQLSHLAGNSGQTVAGQGAIVTPGVSKKLLESLTRENIKLRQALDHITNRGPSGVDLAMENRELHEIIMTLRDERDKKINEVNELKNLLTAVQDQNTEFWQNQALHLTAQTAKLERNLNAKQGFLEAMVTENESLKKELQTLKDEKITRVQDPKRRLGDLANSPPEVRQIMNQVYDNEDGNSEHEEERERLHQKLRELQNDLTLLARECQEKQKQIDELQMDHELMRTAENRELHEMLMTLRDERDMKSDEVNELKNLLAAVQDQNTEFLQNQVLRLTAQTTKLERNLNAKQGFLETMVTENESLKNELQTLKNENITKVQDLKRRLGDLANSPPEVRQIINQVYDNEDGNSETLKDEKITRVEDLKRGLGDFTGAQPKMKQTQLYQVYNNLDGNSEEKRELLEKIRKHVALEEEQDVEITELNELQNSLTGLQNQNREFLQNQILPLTAQNTKLERNLNAQQGFLETIVTAKNGSLESELQTLKDEKITQVQDLKRGLGKLASSQPELRQIMNQVYDNEDGNSKEPTTSQELNRLKEENNKVREELHAKIEENNHLKDELAKTMEELTTLKQVNEIHNAQQQPHKEERERLPQQLRELQDTLTLLTRECEEKKNQIEELQLEHELMRTALSGYENDFKMERQEKNKALSEHQKIIRERDLAIHSYEQLKREHTGLRQSIERMYLSSQAQAQQQAQAAYRRQPSAARTCAPQEKQQQPVLRPRGYGMEACADGPEDDCTDAPINPPNENPKPAPRRYLSLGSQHKTVSQKAPEDSKLVFIFNINHSSLGAD